MTRILPIVCLLFCSSCFLLRDIKRDSFSYNANGQARTIPLFVPKGFSRERVEADSAGNTVKYYSYGNGTVFYAAYVTDTSKQYQYINYEKNLPLEHIRGGLIFKGLDSTNRYWREIRLRTYKFGYKNVSRSQEGDFDEALNKISLQDLQ